MTRHSTFDHLPPSRRALTTVEFLHAALFTRCLSGEARAAEPFATAIPQPRQDRPPCVAVIELSGPPDRNDPTSTSATIPLRTASSSTRRNLRQIALLSTFSSASAAPWGVLTSAAVREDCRAGRGRDCLDGLDPIPSKAFNSETRRRALSAPRPHRRSGRIRGKMRSVIQPGLS